MTNDLETIKNVFVKYATMDLPSTQNIENYVENCTRQLNFFATESENYLNIPQAIFILFSAKNEINTFIAFSKLFNESNAISKIKNNFQEFLDKYLNDNLPLTPETIFSLQIRVFQLLNLYNLLLIIEQIETESSRKSRASSSNDDSIHSPD